MGTQERTVLVVDDEADARLFVRSVFEQHGWCVIEAHDGAEAVRLAEEEAPDLIVLDIVMPEMDGFEAFRRIRGGESTAAIPIFVLTSVNEFEQDRRHDEVTMEIESELPGPEGFIEKPVDADFLMFAVNTQFS